MTLTKPLHHPLFKTTALAVIATFLLQQSSFAFEPVNITPTAATKPSPTDIGVRSQLSTLSAIPQNEKVIVHMNSNHYVTVTSIDASGNITYYEPNMGLSGERVTVSRSEFMKIWKGCSLLSRAPPAIFTSFFTKGISAFKTGNRGRSQVVKLWTYPTICNIMFPCHATEG